MVRWRWEAPRVLEATQYGYIPLATEVRDGGPTGHAQHEISIAKRVFSIFQACLFYFF